MRVLAIDGGGIRGIVPAVVLEALEQEAGAPVATLFDLVAGTSTGGMLACGLTVPGPDGRPRHTASTMVGLYKREGPTIFRRSLWHELVSADGLVEEKHEATALESVLARYLDGARLSDATTKLLVTAYDIEAREPFFFKSWRTHERGRDFTLSTVARATSAAPIYFEPALAHPLDGSRPLALIDGGVFANNPAMCAYAEAQRLEPGSRTQLLSLGTGQLTKPIPYARARHWGVVQWVRPVIDVVFDGVADTVDYQLHHVLTTEEYARLQVTLTAASDAMDDASARNIARLEEQAHELVASKRDTIARVAEALTG